MAQLFEGNCKGKVINPEIGKSGNAYRARWEMEVTEGPHAGKRASYSGKLDEANIKFTKRDMMLIGWQGKDVRTFVDDVKKAAKVVEFTAEIATNTYQDTGKTSQWTSARFGGSKPLDAIEGDKIADVNRWFAEAGDVGKASDEDLPF